eukprot:11197300-Lingulodinium_polyedra.AAC.1
MWSYRRLWRQCLSPIVKVLFGGVNRSRSVGLGLSLRQAASEALPICHICGSSSVIVKWVDSDRQDVDIFTKQGVPSDAWGKALASN